MTKPRRGPVRRPTGVRPVRPAVAARGHRLPEHREPPAIGDAVYRHIVASLRNGVLSVARDGTLAFMNGEAYRILGLTPAEGDLGRPIAEVLSTHPDVVRALTSAFDLHMLANRAELRLRPSDKVIGYTLTHVRDDTTAVVGVAMLFKDLTRVEQLEERERLRDRLAALGEMAAAIAHEVKNPLAGIEVMAGLLRRKTTSSPDTQAVLTDIINEAKMANAIVQEVLEFVRPIRLQVERTAVADAVRAASQLADSKARRGSIDVHVELPAGLPQIQADRHQLTRLFTNLLINAYEAMDGRGCVTISAAPANLDDGDEERAAVLMEIADDGPGIPTDVADRVFAPFFTTKAQGSGLGLAIVRKIVDAHDGQIDLQTSVGRGTRIRITLPVSSGGALTE
ncbi:MAG: ATP-binding protein [Vicinamibacterales bacterium]